MNIIKRNQSKNLRIIAITGGKGKTTVAHLLHHIFTASGQKVGLISSLGYSIDGEIINKNMNADKLKETDLSKILSAMKKNGIEIAIVEMTPKNLNKKRFAGVEVESGIITNFLNDDTDYFKTWESYAKTKIDFINKIREEGLLILNNEDENITQWLQLHGDEMKKNIYTFWVEPGNINETEYNLKGMELKSDGNTFFVPILGHYNSLNALQSIKLAQSYLPVEQIQSALKTFEHIPGRMQIIKEDPFTVIIDSAYKSADIENSLLFLNNIKSSETKIISIIGSPERDTSYIYQTPGGKMKNVSHLESGMDVGVVAKKYSSLVVLAAEDVRTQRIVDMNSEIYQSVEKEGGIMVERLGSEEEYSLINKENLRSRIERVRQNGDVPFVSFDANDYTSRLNAIDFALKNTAKGDIVYISGKGTDNQITIGNVVYEWNDEEAVKQVLG